MSRKFSVGDRVRIVHPQSDKYGQVHTVVRVRTNATLIVNNGPEITVPVAYEVDAEPTHPEAKWCGYQPHHLEPYYDGNEKTSWSDCVWKPAGVRA